MAIQKSVSSRHGISASSSYSRIASIMYDREKTSNNVTVRFKVWKDASSRTGGKDPLEYYTFIFTFDEGARASSLMAQAYAALKLQDDLGGNDFTSGTTDV
jgi:hypothetical protein